MTDPAADPTVGALPEGTILRAILARLGPSTALVGPGDDAAVLAAPGGAVVATTDTLVHGPDFRLAWSSGFDLGWKAAAVNLADVAAMGARPTALLVALAMPESTRLSFVEQLADGLRAACEALAPDCAVEGGDLTVSPTLTIAVTALGVLEGAPVRRSGARPGDQVALAGEVGVAARGLALLFARATDAAGEATALDPASLTADERHAVERQRRPVPPVASGVAAAAAGATALMDVSDGLALDATRLAEASGVTVDLDRGAVGDEPEALTGGEDHGLLATFAASTPLPAGFRRIGRIVARAGAALTVGSRPFAGDGGWDPYRDWDRHAG